jgi:hypothetical protein
MTEVKVRDKKSGAEQTLTYSAYKDVAYMFDLIGQVDSNGNLILGDPNLLPQHQRKSATVVAADAGQQQRPKFDVFQIPEALRAQFEEKKKVVEPDPEPVKVLSEQPEKPSEEKPTKRKYTKRKTEV